MTSNMIRSGLLFQGRRTTASSSVSSSVSLFSRSAAATRTFATKGDGKDSKDQKDKKENFAKKFLDPAARGELQKHQSGIPKLAVRKPKGHEVKDSFPGRESEEILKDALNVGGGGGGEGKNVSTTGVPGTGIPGRQQQQQQRGGKRNTTGRGGPQGRGNSMQGRGNNMQQGGPQGRGGNTQQQQQQKKEAPEIALASLFQGVKPEELNPTLQNNNRKWLGSKSSMQQNQFHQQRNVKQQQFQRGGRDRPKYDIWGDEELPEEVNDPWVTDAMYFKYVNPHSESKREPKPVKFPTNRYDPPAEFVEAHGAFAYVTNVPRPVVDGELGSQGNPLHRHGVVEFVADVFSVPASNVFCANMTSAFIGFTDAKEAAEAIVKSEGKRIIQGSKIESVVYSTDGADAATDAEKEFVKGAASPESIVKLENVPAGMMAATIARVIHDAIVISDKDVLMSSPTTALIRTSSAEAATALLDNSNLYKTLASLQRQILRVHSARRHVIHDKFAGPARQIQMKKMTHRLIVNGDVPSKNFFLSHAKVLHLTHVPVGIGKKDISDYFQKFSSENRDVEGSIEIVKSYDGYPTGRVYVGFDLAKECDEALNEISGLGDTIVFKKAALPTRVRAVADVAMVRGSKLGARSERTQEELIASFSAWKNDVDPKDIETLELYGITIDVLEEAFMAARRNPSFAAEDQAREGERMREEYGPGGHFQEFVQMYIDTLKELGSTKEKPGLKYESMFLPDEDLEYSLFDDEEKRLVALRKEFGN